MKRVYSLVIVTLLVCLFIYWFYRTERTLVNEILIAILSTDTFADLQAIIKSTVPLGNLMIFSLPGGLWVFCTTILSKDFYLELGKRKVQLAGAPIMFAVGLELMQLAGVANGTFDFWDLAFYLMFWCLAYFTFRPRVQQNILAPLTFNSFMCLSCFFSVYLAHVSY